MYKISIFRRLTKKESVELLGSGPLDDTLLVEEHVQGSPNNDQRDEVCFIVMSCSIITSNQRKTRPGNGRIGFVVSCIAVVSSRLLVHF